MHVYTRRMNAEDLRRIAMSVLTSVGLFLLCVLSTYRFKNFGRLLMVPMIAAMWLFGNFVAYYLPAQRKLTINQTYITIASYCGTLLLIHEMIALTSGVSGNMLMATFNEAIPVTLANSAPSYLQGILGWAVFMIPFGFFIMQAKKLVSFSKQKDKNKTLERLRSYRNV